MSALLPAAFYGLHVPGGDMAVEAQFEFPAAIRITMAAIDTSEEYVPEDKEDPPKVDNQRCVLRIIRLPYDMDDEDDDSEFDSDEEEELRAIINGESSDEEANGGPSDPEKSKKARKEAAAKALKEALADSDDMVVDGAGAKGKGISLADDSDEDEEDDEDDDEAGIEEFVLCTLDADKHFQQTLDITIGEREQVLFRVTGNYSINLTGNYVMPVDDRAGAYDSDEEDEYDLSPDEDELDIDELDSEEDELDDLEDPRITELDSEEEAPKLVKDTKKGKKRPAESDDEPAGLDEIIGKSLKKEEATNGDFKLSKKQQKKLKNNAGEAVAAAAKAEEKPATESPASKKVQFAKNLEQGPTGSGKTESAAGKADAGKAASVRVINGVTIDDRKTGKGPAAKKGNRISMRYIGKLTDGKQFDANKTGKPFSFKLGAGEVIQGWDIGVEGIQAGGERRITVPADKAYGKKKLPGIPANSTLIFDVKCIEIK